MECKEILEQVRMEIMDKFKDTYVEQYGQFYDDSEPIDITMDEIMDIVNLTIYKYQKTEV